MVGHSGLREKSTFFSQTPPADAQSFGALLLYLGWNFLA